MPTWHWADTGPVLGRYWAGHFGVAVRLALNVLSARLVISGRLTKRGTIVLVLQRLSASSRE